MGSARVAGGHEQILLSITKEDIEFLRGMMTDPVKFERWANDLLDRAHGHNVERRHRR